MAKVKSKWVCQNCGYETASYLGKCPDCGRFSTFVEEIVQEKSEVKSKNSSMNIGNTETFSYTKRLIIFQTLFHFSEKLQYQASPLV